MKVKIYDDDDRLLWMGTVERMEPEPASGRPFRAVIEVRDFAAVLSVPADSYQESSQP